VRFPVQYSGIEGPVALGYLESVYRDEGSQLQGWLARTAAESGRRCCACPACDQ
jgi:hypothetical protein